MRDGMQLHTKEYFADELMGVCTSIAATLGKRNCLGQSEKAELYHSLADISNIAMELKREGERESSEPAVDCERCGGDA